MQTQLIVNPRANKGKSLKLLPQITQTLHNLGVSFEVKQTERPEHATMLALRAAANGYERVVAVGGDSTCNEVVNGLLKGAAEGYRAYFSTIPVGSGNDLAFGLGIPGDPLAACATLKQGTKKTIDVGKVTVDGQSRFFANSIGLGFDAEVTVDALKSQILKGFAMYLWSVFRVTAFGKWPYMMKLALNQTTLTQPITLITVANGVRAGGGFLLTPDAKLDDGLFDICYADQLSRFQLLTLLPKTFDGSHIHDAAITMVRSNHIRISVEGGVAAHVDGEILCLAGKEFEIILLPQALPVWA